MNKADKSLQKLDRVVRLGKPHGGWVSLYIKRKKILCMYIYKFLPHTCEGAPSGLSGLSGLMDFVRFNAGEKYHNDVATAVARKKVAHV